MQDYEYKDEGGRYLCKLHGRLRCDECHYVSELQERNKRYREAVEKIEELYNEIHSRTARGCANDYLDGLETALHIIQRGE